MANLVDGDDCDGPIGIHGVNGSAYSARASPRFLDRGLVHFPNRAPAERRCLG